MGKEYKEKSYLLIVLTIENMPKGKYEHKVLIIIFSNKIFADYTGMSSEYCAFIR